MFSKSIKFLVILVVLGITPHALGMKSIQSTFTGPARAKVWQHWQQSWNVEDLTTEKRPDFTLTRGYDSNGKPVVVIEFLKQDDNKLTANLTCDGYTKDGKWTVKHLPGKTYSTSSSFNDGQFSFEFEAEDCLDVNAKRLVTKIKFDISKGSNRIYEYSVLPMYVRGKDQSYWENSISPYSAHAGKGEITVSNSMTAESGWDKWGDALVRPVLSFVDRNTMTAGSDVGLHRHEKNQEVYFIESGEAEMVMGVSSKKSDIYQTDRVWSIDGEVKSVNEFYAEGGWVEKRVLNPGQISVIIPNPNNDSTVYFHGIKATKDTAFWTMGSKN